MQEMMNNISIFSKQTGLKSSDLAEVLATLSSLSNPTTTTTQSDSPTTTITPCDSPTTTTTQSDLPSLSTMPASRPNTFISRITLKGLPNLSHVNIETHYMKNCPMNVDIHMINEILSTCNLSELLDTDDNENIKMLSSQIAEALDTTGIKDLLNTYKVSLKDEDNMKSQALFISIIIALILIILIKIIGRYKKIGADEEFVDNIDNNISSDNDRNTSTDRESDKDKDRNTSIHRESGKDKDKETATDKDTDNKFAESLLDGTLPIGSATHNNKPDYRKILDSLDLSFLCKLLELKTQMGEK